MLVHQRVKLVDLSIVIVSYSAYSSTHKQKNNCNSATSHKKLITEVRVTMYYICGHVPIILSIFRQMFETSKEFYLLMMPCDIIM